MSGGGCEYLEQHRMVPDLRRADRRGTGPQLAHLAAPRAPQRDPGRRVVAGAAGPLPDRLDPAGRADRLGGRGFCAVVCGLAPDLGRGGPPWPCRADTPGLTPPPAPD